jgi:dipeptidyl aminopeptidase/acylaminoacyl peptidase
MHLFIKALWILGCMALVALPVAAVMAARERTQPPLIPREKLFGNPDKASAQISHDGHRISYLAPVDGVLNVWVGPADAPDQAKPVTHDKGRGIRMYTNRHILYLQDKEGDENWRVYSVDLATDETKDLTPLEGVRAEIEEVSYKFPQAILVGLNNRDPQLHDIYRVNIETAERELVQKNEGFAGFVTDDDFRIRFAMRYTPDGGTELLRKEAEQKWQPFLKVPMEDALTTSPVGFNQDGTVLYMLESGGRNTAALFAVTLSTAEKKLLAEDPRADIGGVMIHPTEKNVQAVTFTYERMRRVILDKSVADDFSYLSTVADGDLAVSSRTLDNKHWIATYVMDNGPVRYYLYDRDARKARFLFTNRKSLEGLPLAKMHPVVIRSRDELDLVSYYTIPPGSDSDEDGRPDKPVPMVLNVHGGPWARDAWGFDPVHQWLANRGYAVLSVNYRGSTGFGKAFLNAGNLEWARKMHDDLLDAVDWAVHEGIADPKRVAIFGGSYGGYATLVGLTTTPDRFACGVDIVGPSNLITLLNSIPPYWAPQIELFTQRVGDHRSDEGKAFLKERSPLTYVDRIKKPLLIGQGANDPRVKQAEADQIVQAMQEKKIPVTYVLYPDEGHGFARPQNRLSFNAIAEAFLAEHLGGRYEPIGDDFRGASLAVPVGASGVPGLEQALSERKQPTQP